MRLWDLSIRRPVSVFMGLVCILLLGYISARQLKLAFLPKVDFPAMWVVVTYPNQNPQLLEREVTQPLEEALSTIKGVDKITSETDADTVVVRLDFKWGMTLDLIRLELGLKIEEIKPDLPDGIRQIQIFSFNTNDIPVVEGRISAPGIDLSENYDLLERHIKQRLERIPGVAKVDLGGVLPKEVSIELRIDAIKAHGVDVERVIQRLAQDNITMSAGKIESRGMVFNIRTLGKIETLEEFENLVVDDRGLLLKEVADIYYEEPPIGYRRHLDGDFALAVVVYKESTANTVEVATEVNRVIKDDIGSDPLLQGISLLVWGDQAKQITNGLRSLSEAGFYGALFAIIVLFLFLRRLNATLIVAAAIPISVLGSFIFLYAFGYTLNVLTLMGLMLAVGMLVDNAVVVLEAIYQKHLNGLEAVEATKQGTKEVIVALIAATSTTMIVFLSLVVSDANELSVWLGAIGLTICFTLTMSLLVSITIIPLFASRFLKKTPPPKAAAQNRLLSGYSKILDWTIVHPRWTTVIMVSVILLAFVPFQFLEQFKGSAIKTHRLAVEYEFHDFFFLSEVEERVDKVEAYLESKREEWEVESIYTWMRENEAVTVLTFENENLPFERFKAIRKEMRAGLPEIGGISFRFDDDEDEGGQGVRVQLFGSDSYTLEKVAEGVAQVVQEIDGIYDVKAKQRSGKRELQVTLDRERANKYGISPEDISEVFGFTLGATYLPRFRHGERERDVTLGLRIQDRATIEDVSSIPLGGNVTLGSVAEFSFVESPGEIRRVNRKAHHVVRATYEGEDYEGMMEQVEEDLKGFTFPPGVTWSWSDRMIKDEDQMQDMMSNILLAFILVYLVMACLFESLVQPIMILFTIPFSLFGVSWFLLITGTEFGVMSAIGLMILLGIVVNNGIVMMDHINQQRRRGLELVEAVRLGARERIRPILMTAATTVIGLIPMAIGQSGIGNAYYFPLARCVIGGLTSSTLLTVIGLPWVILGHDKLWGWTKAKVASRRKKRRAKHQMKPSEATS